jgi:hypothetical protein
MKAINGIIKIEHVDTITGVNFSDKTIYFSDESGIEFKIDCRSIFRLLYVMERECKTKKIDFDAFIVDCMKLKKGMI